MNKIHETQSTKDPINYEEDKLYTPFVDLQTIETGGVYKRSSFRLKSMPKGIRFIGYFIISFFIVAGILMIVLNLFF